MGTCRLAALMTDTSSVQVRGQLTVADLYRFSVYALVSRFWFFLGIIVSVVLIMTTELWTGRASWEWTTQTVASSVFFLVLMPYIFFVAPYFSAKKQLEKNPHLSGPTTVTFSDVGLHMIGPHSESRLDWSGIVKVRETSTLFLIYPQQALTQIMPKRYFASVDDESRVREMLRSHVKDAKLKKA
jgi:hypothetical protein